MSDEPCTCHDCVVANVGRPAVTIPANRYEPARTLHGRELVKHYEGEDKLRAMITELRRKGVGK